MVLGINELKAYKNRTILETSSTNQIKAIWKHSK